MNTFHDTYPGDLFIVTSGSAPEALRNFIAQRKGILIYVISRVDHKRTFHLCYDKSSFTLLINDEIITDDLYVNDDYSKFMKKIE